MTAPVDRNRIRLVPGIVAVGAAIAVGVYTVGSPVGSRQLSTVALAGVLIGATVVSVVSIAAGRDDVALAIGLLFFAVGTIGFALGPQLWIVGSLVLLSATLDRGDVPYVLLLVIGGLLVLTVLTVSWYRTVTAGFAVVVFAAAAYSTIAARRRIEPA